MHITSSTDFASVGSVFNDTRRVKALSLPETIKEKSTFRAKAIRRELVVGRHVYPCMYINVHFVPISSRQAE